MYNLLASCYLFLRIFLNFVTLQYERNELATCYGK